jgi:DNA-binding MltR family transcriptional regulator
MNSDPETFSRENVNKYYKELQGESQRATAIIGPAILDNLLGIYLEKFFIDNPKNVKELLYNAQSPLGSFSSRILATYCLGLIGSREYNELNFIRKIRNKFAHDLETLSFDNQTIKNYCENLNYPQILYKALPEIVSYNPRDLFIYSVTTLHLILLSRSSSIKNRQQTPKDMFPTLTDNPQFR